MESSHSLPSLLQPERPRRQTQLPARYDEFILQYGQRPQAPAAAQEQQPLYSADTAGTGPHCETQLKRDSDDEEEPEDAELPAENRSPPSSPLPSEGAPAPPHDSRAAPVPDPQTALLQQLLEEVRNRGRLLQQCMIRSSTHSSPSRSLPSPCLDTHGPQVAASSQTLHTVAPPQATTSSYRLSPHPFQQRLPSPPPVSRAPPVQPLVQSWHTSNLPAHSQFPAIRQVPAPHNSLHSVHTLPHQASPSAMTQSAQPVYQPLNAQHHHLTYAAHSNPLAPPVAPLQFYRWVKGPSFLISPEKMKASI